MSAKINSTIICPFCNNKVGFITESISGNYPPNNPTLSKLVELDYWGLDWDNPTLTNPPNEYEIDLVAGWGRKITLDFSETDGNQYPMDEIPYYKITLKNWRATTPYRFLVTIKEGEKQRGVLLELADPNGQHLETA